MILICPPGLTTATYAPWIVFGSQHKNSPSSIFDWNACTSLGGFEINTLCPKVGASSGNDIPNTCIL
eukprot:12261207-Prorocentrum_lima.AAC.1